MSQHKSKIHTHSPQKRIQRRQRQPKPKATSTTTQLSNFQQAQSSISPVEVLQLQRLIGNQGVQRYLQRHTIKDAPPLPEEEVQTKRQAPTLQRHTIKDAPPLPEEEVQTKRQPLKQSNQKDQIQRLTTKSSDLEAGGIGQGGFSYYADLRKVVRFYYSDVKGSTPERHVKLLNMILEKADQFDKKEAETLEKNKWLKEGYEKRKNLVEQLRTEAKEELTVVNKYLEFCEQKYELKDFTNGKNGKFDLVYNPPANLVDINMKVQFTFPEDTAPITEEQDEKQKAYRENFAKMIKKSWSKRYQFKNVREPQVVWGRLTPTDVKVNVIEVDSDPHFEIQVSPTTTGRSSVGGGVTKLWKDKDKPVAKFNPGTATGELKRVERILPTVQFDEGSADVKSTYDESLEFLATYLRRINNPKFKLEIVGHNNKVPEKASESQKISEKRAKAIHDVLVGHGLTNHTLEQNGVGETGATEDGAWRKVVFKHSLDDSSWKNMQDVTPHEFGHMVGLGDEYGSGNATHYDLTKKAFGEKYADQVAKQGDTDYASVMEGGDDVRIQHYVTFWDALVKATTTKATEPDPKFGHDDWKFIG